MLRVNGAKHIFWLFFIIFLLEGNHQSKVKFVDGKIFYVEKVPSKILSLEKIFILGM